MIKQLRRKFIIIAMCSVSIVFLSIIGIINIINYSKVVNNADNLVEILKNGNGNFGRNDGKFMKSHPPMSPETPFETRFFSVEVNKNGEIIAINLENIAAVDNENEAKECIIGLNRKKSSSGFYGNYRYGIFSTPLGGKLYIFVDCTRELTGFRNFLLISAIVSISGLVLVFLLVYFLSGKIMKPIAESYSKKKQFITDASHEIKTPLTIISADTEILEIEHGENEWTSSIKSQIKRLISLTEKLVFLARMNEENKVIKFMEFSISDVVEDTVKSFETVALLQSTPFVCNIEKNISYFGEESMMKQMISLLVDNAIKYSDKDNNIYIELNKTSNKIQFIIKNRNSELLEGNLEYLFERFYRNDQSRNSETGGHGIGLSVVQSIVAVHKGKIVAKNEKGEISFVVTL